MPAARALSSHGPSSQHPLVAARSASEAHEPRSDNDDLTLPERLTNHGSAPGYPDPDQQCGAPRRTPPLRVLDRRARGVNQGRTRAHRSPVDTSRSPPESAHRTGDLSSPLDEALIHPPAPELPIGSCNGQALPSRAAAEARRRWAHTGRPWNATPAPRYSRHQTARQARSPSTTDCSPTSTRGPTQPPASPLRARLANALNRVASDDQNVDTLLAGGGRPPPGLLRGR